MKYLTASQLNITSEERNALIKVKAFLKTIDRVSDPESRDKYASDYSDLAEELPAKFAMNTTVMRYDCGTACCIGGWMSLFMQGIKLAPIVKIEPKVGSIANRYVRDRRYASSLSQLFYPDNQGYDWSHITPSDAIAQITLFLTTGKVTW